MLISAYNSQWPTQYESLKSKLLCKLSDQVINIEHVGSTSIIGLAAKPIIDVDIVCSLDGFEKVKNSLQSLGYFHNGNQGIIGREVFKRIASDDEILDRVAHHLYVYEQNSDEFKSHILFRDYLRNNIIAKEFYQRLKFSLAAEAKDDKKTYAALKQALSLNSLLN